MFNKPIQRYELQCFKGTRVSFALIISIAISAVAMAQDNKATNQESKQQPSKNDQPDLQQRSKDLLDAKTVVFIGDSFTHGGAYIVNIESTLLVNFKSVPNFINLGLPVETVSGLTGPGSANAGPKLMDRIDRILEKSNPDFVFICYGVADGMYSPFDEQRIEAFKKGTRELIFRIDEFGAKVVLITPPPFDTKQVKKRGLLAKADAAEFSRKRPYEKYDEEVISKYAQWIVSLENEKPVYAVVDAYSVITQFIANQRAADPKFTFSADGFTYHAAGHRVFAHSILHAFGFNQSIPQDWKFVGLVRERLGNYHMSWLTHVGHGENPKLRTGLSFDDVEKKMKLVNEKIQAYLDENRPK